MIDVPCERCEQVQFGFVLGTACGLVIILGLLAYDRIERAWRNWRWRRSKRREHSA